MDNLRNEMYLASESLRLMAKSGTPKLEAAELVAMATIGAADAFG